MPTCAPADGRTGHLAASCILIGFRWEMKHDSFAGNFVSHQMTHPLRPLILILNTFISICLPSLPFYSVYRGHFVGNNTSYHHMTQWSVLLRSDCRLHQGGACGEFVFTGWSACFVYGYACLKYQKREARAQQSSLYGKRKKRRIVKTKLAARLPLLHSQNLCVTAPRSIPFLPYYLSAQYK